MNVVQRRTVDSLELGGSAMPPRSLLDCFVEQSRRQPTAPALLWNRERTTYGQLYGMACEAYAQLAQLELPEQGSVGILAKKSPQSIALIIACLMARHKFLLPSVDLGQVGLQKLFEQAGCSHVLSPETDPKASLTGMVSNVVTWENTVAPKDPVGSIRPRPDDISFMLTTSGSTGLPKIVPLSVAAIDRFTDWASEQFDIRAGKTVLNYAPVNFDLCLLDIWSTLKYGACAALVDQDQATNATYLLDLLATNDVHVIQAVPMLYRLLTHTTRNSHQRFEKTEHVIFTGDSMPLNVLEALADFFPNARFYNVYGCTETNDSFIHEVDLSRAPLHGPIPIGQPISDVSALVMAEDGRIVKGSGTGELFVSTPFQTHGYLNEELNDDKFVSCPDNHCQRTYFRTGDLVRLHDDGSITLEGRKDFQVKVRGVRINMQEVEQVLLEHKQVLEVAVVAVPDDTAGNRLHAVVRRDHVSYLNSLALRQHCARRLPRTAIPSTITIVEAALPKTSTGKVDRSLIRRTQMKGDQNGSHPHD
ncbi:MAG: AMP-binding protein [Egibacteraceae bacterium]